MAEKNMPKGDQNGFDYSSQFEEYRGEELELGNPPESHYSILGGWLVDMIEDIPEVDESYSFIQEIINYDHEGEEPRRLLLKFVVKDIKGRRVSYVHLTIEEITED